MTTVYLIRHAESDRSVIETEVRPLTEKGLEDAQKLVNVFRDIEIDRMYSSPYKRALDTVSPLADSCGLGITIVDDFKERRGETVHTMDAEALVVRQWMDFSFSLSDSECFADVQRRNLQSLRDVVAENEGQTLAIGTHGVAMCTMLHFFSPISLKELGRILLTMPYVARIRFDGQQFVDMKELSVL